MAGWIATIAGWYVTEIGRQPWLVRGILKTADAVSFHQEKLQRIVIYKSVKIDL